MNNALVEKQIIKASVEKQTIIELKLGIDFGTRFTKVCFRDCSGQEKSWIVTFSENNSSLDAALLPTKIAISSTGQLLTGLTQSEWQAIQGNNYKFIEFIKIRLANLYIDRKVENNIASFPEVEGVDLSAPIIVENLCAYYLSSVISRAKEWIENKYKDTLLKNRQPRWITNLGVPVEYCDSPVSETFRKVISLALLLSESHPQSLTLSQLSDRMAQCRQKLAHASLDCDTLPEISAAIQSYIALRLKAQEGIHLFFDVGGGTIESVAFHYKLENGLPKIDFYAAKVDQLGVAAISNRLATQFNLTAEQVEAAIINNNYSSLGKIDVESVRLLIQKQVAEVVMVTRKEKEESRKWFDERFYIYDSLVHSPVLISNLQQSCFLGGGGGEATFFQDAIISTHSEFQQNRAGVPAYDEPEVLPKPADLEMNGINSNNFHRFAIAYGLSVQEEGDPVFKLPSCSENALQQGKTNINHARPGEGCHATDSEYIDEIN